MLVLQSKETQKTTLSVLLRFLSPSSENGLGKAAADSHRTRGSLRLRFKLLFVSGMPPYNLPPILKVTQAHMINTLEYKAE